MSEANPPPSQPHLRYQPPVPKPPPAALADLLIDLRHFTYLAQTLRDSYAHFHTRLHAQNARLLALERDRPRLAEAEYWDRRERCLYQRDDVRKRMVLKREGWGEVMGRLKEIRVEIREVRKVIEMGKGKGVKGEKVQKGKQAEK